MTLNGPGVLIGALRDRPVAPFLHDRDQALNCCFKDDLPLLRGRESRVSVNAQAGPAAPEVVESNRVGVDAVRADKLSANVVVGFGLVHLHSLGSQVEIEGGLEFIGVRHHFCFFDTVEGFHRQPKVSQCTAQRVGLKYSFAGDQIDQGCVRAVPVDQENLLKSMVGNAFRDVEAEGDEDVRFDVNCAGKVDMVEVQTVGDCWQNKDGLGRAASRQIDSQRKESTSSGR